MPNPNHPNVGDIVTQARKEAGVGSNPKAAALQPTELILRLNDYNAEGVAYPTKVGYLGFWFNDEEQPIQSIANTALTSGISSGASSLTIDSGIGWDSPSSDLAAGYIKNSNNIYDFFAYESRTNGAISTVNGVQLDHSAAEEVHKIYKLNDDFGWPRALFRQSRSLKYVHKTNAYRQIPLSGMYTTRYIESTNYNGMFLIFPEDVGVYDWMLRYQRAAKNITSTSQSLDLPGRGHGRRYYIESLKSYIYENEGETEDKRESEQKALFHLESLLDEYGIEDMDGNQSISLGDW